VRTELRPRDGLSTHERDAMHRLLDAHFEGVDRERFELDLEEKNWALLLRREDGSLAGFSTILFRRAVVEGSAINLVCSGDTIVDRDAWGSSALPRSWIQAVYWIHGQDGALPLWWLLLTSGFRTYRFLPLFWREFHPRFDAPMPEQARRWRHLLAREQYGSAYDPEGGVVRLSKPQRLREGLGEITPERLSDPHVAFFLRANPGHTAGDELVALTSLDRTNLTRAGRRMVESGESGTSAAPSPHGS